MVESTLFTCKCGDTLICVEPLKICSKCGGKDSYKKVD